MSTQLPNCYINRHGTYYLRTAIPKPIRVILPSNRREIRKSLRTKQHSEAKRRLWVQMGYITHLFESHRPAIMTDNPHRTDEERAAYCEHLAGRFERALAFIEAEDPANANQYEPDHIHEVADSLDNALLRAEQKKADLESKRLSDAMDRAAESAAELKAGLPKGQLSNPAPTISSPVFTPTVEGLIRVNCAEAVKEYIRKNQQGWSKPKTQITRLIVIEKLMVYVANKRPLNQLISDDWATIYGLLQYLPKRTDAENFDSRIDSIVASYESSSQPDPDIHIVRETLTGNQQKLKGICRLAHDREWIRKDFLQSAVTNKPSKKEKRLNKYRDLTPNDIKSLLTGELYQDICPIADKRSRYNEWRFWMLPIALYTGMREKEIAQLHFEDIKTDNETGIKYIRVHDEGDRSVKSEAGIRKVPIHNELEQAGFLRFVEQRSDQKYLFPDLWRKENGMNLSEANANKVNKYFNGDSTKKGYFEKCDVTEDKKVFHSTRHTTVSMLRKRRVDSYFIAKIVGHDKDLGITAHYGTVELADIKTAVNMIDYGEYGSLSKISFETYEKRKPVIRAKARSRQRKK